MNIGFDAKRAYHNKTGLGHYSRTLIHSLAEFYPDNEYFLFNPRPSSLFKFNEENVYEVLPNSFPATFFPSAWRSSWVKKDLKKFKIQLYHGLSHEIPIGIRDTRIKSVVTIHDLIHERFPEQYNAVDVKIYQKKFRYACEHSHRIIAISEQTKKDIVQYYQIPASKIEVCYQSCNPIFGKTVTEEEKNSIRSKYNLPEKFFLHVGSVIERKNLLNICKAVFILRDEIDVPLVVIGDGGKYKQAVKDFIKQNNLGHKIIFLSENEVAKLSPEFQSASNFPAIYQSAIAMIYPSFFEGFGIPVLEALWSRLPVITSNISSLPEAGGPSSCYINPQSAEEIAAAMLRIYTDEPFRNEMKNKGWEYARKFTTQRTTEAVMKLYQSLNPSK